MNVVKRIFRYLSRTQHLGLYYPGSSIFELISYSDADYTRSKNDKKAQVVLGFPPHGNWMDGTGCGGATD